MDLDEETYELLGFGSTRRFEQLATYVGRRQAQIRAAQSRYAKSAKGKAAIGRRDAKRRESGYFASYYEKNKEKIKAQVKAWRAANKEKVKAYDAARYKRQKSEVEKVLP